MSRFTLGTLNTLNTLFTFGTTDVYTLNGLHGFIRCTPSEIAFLINRGCIIPTIFTRITLFTLSASVTSITLGTFNTYRFNGSHSFIRRSPGEIPILINRRSIVATIFTLRSFRTRRTILENRILNSRHSLITGSPSDMTIGTSYRGVVTTSRASSTSRTFDIDGLHALHRFIRRSPTECTVFSNIGSVIATIFAISTGSTISTFDNYRFYSLHSFLGRSPSQGTIFSYGRGIITTGLTLRTLCTRGTISSRFTLGACGTLNVGTLNRGHLFIRSYPRKVTFIVNCRSVVTARLALRALGSNSTTTATTRQRNRINCRHISLAGSKGYITRLIN